MEAVIAASLKPAERHVAKAPGITQWVPLPCGAVGEFLRDPLGYQLRARERFGDVFRFRAGPLLVHYLYHPDHVRRVLHEKQKNYLRGWHYRLLRRLFGENLVVSDGEYWMRQRRLAQPAFDRRRFPLYAEAMAGETQRMLIRWRETAEAGKPIDVGREMSRLALAIAGRTLFSRDLTDEADAVGATFKVVAASLERRLTRPFTTPPAWMPTPANRRFKRAARDLNEIVLSLIRERRDGRDAESDDCGDLLTMLIRARDEETGEGMTDEQLRSEVLTFLIAGHETTAAVLTWTWHLLAMHPAIREQVRQEALEVLGDGPPARADVARADVARLELARMAIEEAMRLYPPIWATPRQAVGDDEIDGCRIPAGSTVCLSSFVTHRHPDFWENAGAFDPGRFTPQRVARRHKGAYFPFLAGPHQCIGMEFAMLEMRLIVALVLPQFDLEPLPGEAVQPKPSLTLRPSRPLWMTLRSLDRLSLHCT